MAAQLSRISLDGADMLLTKRQIVFAGVAALVCEVALFGLTVATAGPHGPMWYTQLPVLMVVGLLDPSVGSCPSCAPLAFAAGALVEALLIWCVALLVYVLLRNFRENPV